MTPQPGADDERAKAEVRRAIFGKRPFDWGVFRSVLRYRRQKRDLLKAGYEGPFEPVWELVRGGRYQERIADVVIGVDGKSIYVRTDHRRNPPHAE